MELISLVVPVYNAEKYLRRCLDSVINQTYEHLDVLIIDDGSTDGSLQICKEYANQDKRIRIICKNNRGVSNTRNVGIDNARGEWICFIDSDDYIEKEYVQCMHQLAQKAGADIVAGGVVKVSGVNKRIVRHKCSNLEIGGEDIKRLLCSILDNKTDEKGQINPQLLGYPISKLYRKSLIGGVRFSENVSIREDALFNLDVMIRASKIVVSDFSFYSYVIHEDSASGSFHVNYNNEVYLFINSCCDRWEKLNLPKHSLYIGLLYIYMMWLKLYVMHDGAGFCIRERIDLLRQSYDGKVWNEAFSGVEYHDLTKPYKVLKWLFMKRCSLGICVLYLAYKITRKVDIK